MHIEIYHFVKFDTQNWIKLLWLISILFLKAWAHTYIYESEAIASRSSHIVVGLGLYTKGDGPTGYRKQQWKTQKEN